jgi:hypothetical protein
VFWYTLSDPSYILDATSFILKFLYAFIPKDSWTSLFAGRSCFLIEIKRSLINLNNGLPIDLNCLHGIYILEFNVK